MDTTSKEVQFGGRVAMILPGYDYKFTVARGLWDDQSDRYGFDSVYVYAELLVPSLGAHGTTLRLGRWGTAIGCELIEALGAPFVSRSYNFQYNPFTHTGVQATTQLNENWTMYHGIVTGADVFFDAAGTLSYVGGLRWEADDAGTSVAANVFVTAQGYDAEQSFQHYDSYNVLLTQSLFEDLTYTLDVTGGHTPDTDPTGAAGGSSADWYGFANYLAYQMSEQVQFNARGEFFHDDKGVRTGTSGDYTAFTIGLQFQPNEWLIMRPCGRFDHNSNRPFEGDSDLFSGGLEVIARW